VLEGKLRAKVDGEQRDLEPSLRTEAWFRSIDRLHREGRVGKNGLPGPLAFGVYLTEYRDVFRLAGPPELVTRPLLGFLGLLGRAKGYRT
jgi:hypothetical protein